jgi:hypothetical protein
LGKALGMSAAEFDDDLIPRGDCCYDTRAASDPNDRTVYLIVASQDTCPYWRPTDHGTILCERLDVEAIIEWDDYTDNLRQATTALGDEALARIRVSATFLTDQIKICNINTEVPGFDEPIGHDLDWQDG